MRCSGISIILFLLNSRGIKIVLLNEYQLWHSLHILKLFKEQYSKKTRNIYIYNNSNTCFYKKKKKTHRLKIVINIIFVND